jgi:hypothetical protein
MSQVDKKESVKEENGSASELRWIKLYEQIQ